MPKQRFGSVWDNSVANLGIINVNESIEVLAFCYHGNIVSGFQVNKIISVCSACRQRHLDTIIMKIGWHLPEIFDSEAAYMRKFGDMGSLISNAEVPVGGFGPGW